MQEELNILMKSTDIKIKEGIDINHINNFIVAIEDNKPIPIIFYNKNLVEIKNSKNKCSVCKRVGQYNCDNVIYCWVHAHTLT